ncbi:MAG: hypothetical protein KAJ10_07120, partial [Thermodesulfovibrionia bacterium]|nr:hypothetical protein [Thermodesulfovibrionia bacterium]
LWMKERLRDILITKTKPSDIKYKRVISLKSDSKELLRIADSIEQKNPCISVISVFSKDTHIYVPSSRYYTGMKEPPFYKTFSQPVRSARIDWEIGGDAKAKFIVN